MAGDERLEEEGDLAVVPRKPYLMSRKNVKDSVDKFGSGLEEIKNGINAEKVFQCPKVNGSSNSSHHPRFHSPHIPHLLPPSLPNNTDNTSPFYNPQNKTCGVSKSSDVSSTASLLPNQKSRPRNRALFGLGQRGQIQPKSTTTSRILIMDRTAKCSSRVAVDPDSRDPLSRTQQLSRTNSTQVETMEDEEGDDDEEELDGDENMDPGFEMEDEERPLSSLMESKDNKEKCAGRMRKNKRRTLRFHSSESSDSGVAALSSTDSSQSSGTSDITEPCSPPSPVSPPSSLGPSDVTLHHHHGFEVTNSPPSCQGSYDSGVEETPTSQSPDPTTPSDSSDHKDDQNLEEQHVLEEEDEDDLYAGEVDCQDGSNQPKSFSGDLHRDRGSHENVVQSEEVTAKIDSSKLVTNSVMVNVKEKAIANTRDRVKNVPGIEVQALVENSEVCHWTKCFQELPSGSDMIEHMRSAHVDAQVNAESFVCLWEGCKVYNRASCSLSWLERHVLTHSGTKPFKCIVDGCGQRFTSQNALERHVNSHFNQQQSHNGNTNGKRKDETTPSKIIKKKRLRYRKSLWTARNDDFFDAGIMEMVRHQLTMLSNHTRLDLDGSSNSVTFQSTVIARQVEPSGQVRMLLHWVPENIIPDEWVFESQVLSSSKQTIPLSSLPRDALDALDTPSTYFNQSYRRKSRRK